MKASGFLINLKKFSSQVTCNPDKDYTPSFLHQEPETDDLNQKSFFENELDAARIDDSGVPTGEGQFPR